MNNNNKDNTLYDDTQYPLYLRPMEEEYRLPLKKDLFIYPIKTGTEIYHHFGSLKTYYYWLTWNNKYHLLGDPRWFIDITQVRQEIEIQERKNNKPTNIFQC